MEKQIISFKNPQFGEIRSLPGENGEPWFVGKDVANILGYSNPRKAMLDHVDEEDKTDGVTIRDSIGRPQNPILINESGLYSLILASRLSTARDFKRWVTSEVLPSIRQHGVYMTDQSLEKALADPDYLIRLATVIKEERSRRKEVEAKYVAQNQLIVQQQNTIGLLDKQVTSLHESVNGMKEKVSYLDSILDSGSSLKTTQIAAEYGISAIRLNRILHDLKIQYKVNGQWILYMEYKDKGYVKNSTVPITDKNGSVFVRETTVWTPKGRHFFTIS